jgi:hypothetical protein
MTKYFLVTATIGCVLYGLGCNSAPPVAPIVIKDPTKFTWTVDTVVAPTSYQTLISSIWGISPQDLYMVGFSSNGLGIMYRFNGTSWLRVPISRLEGGPIYGSLELSTIYGFAANDIWAAGSRIYHFDGGTWNRIDVPVPPQGMSFSSIAEVALNDVYTVGFINDATPPADTGSYFLYHFDGTTWIVVDSVVITSSYVGPIRFGTKLAAISGRLFSSGQNGVEMLTSGTWANVLDDTRIGKVAGNDFHYLFAIGSEGSSYWWNGMDWAQFSIPKSGGMVLSAAWTDGNQAFICGWDAGGHKSYIFHGK